MWFFLGGFAAPLAENAVSRKLADGSLVTLVGGWPDGEYVVTRAGEAYDALESSPKQKFQLRRFGLRGS